MMAKYPQVPRLTNLPHSVWSQQSRLVTELAHPPRARECLHLGDVVEAFIQSDLQLFIHKFTHSQTGVDHAGRLPALQERSG